MNPVVQQGMQILVRYARELGYAPTITSTDRSRATQARLYADYLAGRSRWPAAPPGTSKHEKGLAFDMVIRLRNGQPDLDALRYLGSVWESWGGRWGGRFNDEIHFEV